MNVNFIGFFLVAIAGGVLGATLSILGFSVGAVAALVFGISLTAMGTCLVFKE